jgi:DNA-binding NtrC family response regulator
LAEAELFGHGKGVFTGADRARTGYFRDAHQGTLLLDEIADLPMALQAKLLRVLEQKAVVPLGETRAIAVDTRIVAAAQEPLGQLLRDRRFRADLLARIEGVVVKLPPLRERREEIPFLFTSRIRAASAGRDVAMTPGFVERLCLYDWPFNVREMDLLARRLVATHGPEHILGTNDLPAPMALATPAPSDGQRTPAPTSASQASAPQAEPSLDQLTAALRTHKGNIARAAQSVGISRQRAYRLLDGTDLSEFRGIPGPA